MQIWERLRNRIVWQNQNSHVILNFLTWQNFQANTTSVCSPGGTSAHNYTWSMDVMQLKSTFFRAGIPSGGMGSDSSVTGTRHSEPLNRPSFGHWTQNFITLLWLLYLTVSKIVFIWEPVGYRAQLPVLTEQLCCSVTWSHASIMGHARHQTWTCQC